MSDPLIRKQLPSGWIDLVVGEAQVIRDALHSVHPPETFALRYASRGCDYQPPSGYRPLVAALERRHGSNVVVTAGAKQGLVAAFFAAKERGATAIAMRAPYWSQMPAAVKLAGLRPITSDEPVPGAAYLLVAPNNPDGWMPTWQEVDALRQKCKELGSLLIHDAAYCHEAYGCTPWPVADISVFSVSKLYGLSGLRAGYVVTGDLELHDAMCKYVEASTVGVSLPAQRIVHRIVAVQDEIPEASYLFASRAKEALKLSREIVSCINPFVLEARSPSEHGMFGWFKKGPLFNEALARVACAPGEAFGSSEHVRLNLAVRHTVLSQAVRRFNLL